MAGRFNAGVCLLEPSLALLEFIMEQVDPFRELSAVHEDWPEEVAGDIFGAAWRRTWTPEEDARSRAIT
eukprot:2019883-Alexandrium_andersonii.AAC.1